MTAADTPRALGYRMPAEWEPHRATWLSWPHNRTSWPGAFEPVPAIWAELTRVLAEVEAVHILAGGGPVLAEARRLVGQVPNVAIHEVPTNDAWIRDHGPTFLVGPPGSPPALVHWGYNAWGDKYGSDFRLDAEVPRRVAEITGRRRFVPGIILEGGAIDSNGRGTILTTRNCLLREDRNPGLNQADYERFLADYLGARHVLWLDQGIAGDDTDGHIDELARFVGPRTVVAAVEPDPADENYAPLAENLRLLRTFTDEEGRPLEIVEMPLPRPLWHPTEDGSELQRMPGCYLNFYLANGIVIVPQFDDPGDALAVRTLAKLFPERRVCPLPARELVWGLGAYHCVTQQEPALV